LNINSWAGGVKVWKKNSFSDGLIEVIGIKNMVHLGMV